jgi:diguanylate cyclase (GGDEF)-like protein
MCAPSHETGSLQSCPPSLFAAESDDGSPPIAAPGARLDEPGIRRLVGAIPQLVWRSRDHGDWDWVGPQWGVYTGQDAGTSLGKGWLLFVHPDDRPATMRAWESAGILGALEVEHRLRRSDGAYRWYQTRAACLPDEGSSAPGRSWVGTSTDVDVVRRTQDRIQFLAYHDVLTGAANRALLEKVLHQTVDAATLGAGWCNVLFVDLDRFKAVNDRLGHGGGDDLLRLFAERLRGCLRDGDLLARTGGDEFVVLQRAGPPEEPTQLAERLRRALAQGFTVQGAALRVTASIGVAGLALGETGAAETLLLQADLAVYRAKAAGGDCARFYESWMEAMLRARRALECDLRRAIANDELGAHYQPIIDIATGQVVGFEALARWRHPQRGLLQAESFLPLAEEARLMPAIGATVLDLACSAAALWDGRLGVTVNVSASEIADGDLLRTVSDALATTGLSPERLELDVTEALLTADDSHAIATLHDIRALGVRIALDNFGAGTSSLAALCRFPFDAVRIDGSLVRGMQADPACYAMVKSVVALAVSLDLRVTAEGVETASQLAVLQSIGCRQAQGFLFGRPVAESESLLVSL